MLACKSRWLSSLWYLNQRALTPKWNFGMPEKSRRWVIGNWTGEANLWWSMHSKTEILMAILGISGSGWWEKKIEILVNRRRTRRDRLESRVASGMAGLEKGRLESNRLLDPAFSRASSSTSNPPKPYFFIIISISLFIYLSIYYFFYLSNLLQHIKKIIFIYFKKKKNQ